MKNMKLICSLMLLIGIFVSGTALADRGRGHGGHGGHGRVGIGFYFGAPYAYPLYPPPYYYYPYSYYPPTPAQPPVYIEQQGAPEETEEYYWYHCDKPEGYYPYIKECPNGWQKVEPTPPPNPK